MSLHCSAMLMEKITLLHQIAVLKAALAKKEAEPVSIQHKLQSNPHNMQPSSFQTNLHGKDILASSNNQRKLMGEVDCIEVIILDSLACDS